MTIQSLSRTLSNPFGVDWQLLEGSIHVRKGLVDCLWEAILDVVNRIRGVPPDDKEIRAVLLQLLAANHMNSDAAPALPERRPFYQDPANRYQVILDNKGLSAYNIRNGTETSVLTFNQEHQLNDLLADAARLFAACKQDIDARLATDVFLTLLDPMVWEKMDDGARAYVEARLLSHLGSMPDALKNDRLKLLLKRMGDVEWGKGLTDATRDLADTRLRQIDSLERLGAVWGGLPPEAKGFFAPLLDITHTGFHDDPWPALVSGDTDGSTLRSVILGIQAGFVSLSTDGFKLIHDLMEREAACAANPDLKAFQSDEKLHGMWRKLDECLTFHAGGLRPLVFIGDVCHDRFSCNKDVDRKIREQLHRAGVIYILGNHDSKASAARLKVLTGGKHALDTADSEEWKTHELRVFDGAHFDEATTTLYVHNGLRWDDATGQIDSAFGKLSVPLGKHAASNGKKLAGALRRAAVEMTATEEKSRLDHFTDFRPKPDEIQKVADKLGIRIVHGHDGNFQPTDRAQVVSLNPRAGIGTEAARFVTSAVSLGRWCSDEQAAATWWGGDD